MGTSDPDLIFFFFAELAFVYLHINVGVPDGEKKKTHTVWGPAEYPLSTAVTIEKFLFFVFFGVEKQLKGLTNPLNIQTCKESGKAGFHFIIACKRVSSLVIYPEVTKTVLDR